LLRKALNYDFDCLLSLAEEIKRIQKQPKISFLFIQAALVAHLN